MDNENTELYDRVKSLISEIDTEEEGICESEKIWRKDLTDAYKGILAELE